MDPYTSPNAPLEDPAKAGTIPDAGVEEHRLYAMVLKMVLWGEKKEDVYHRLEVNNVTGPTADLLYNHARADRIATIRDACRKKFLIGIGLILAATVTFCSFWWGLGFLPRLLLYGCFAALGIGLWKTIDGLAGYLMAGTKEGSVEGDL
ncbi:hypothetical protein KBB96_15995 [Luteolibacter ambystomatis]|uniref:DUF2335 domain-containing protein n=1 Tax=Luteolibacter ambystomatis TaxID=2824561 RepID=A0A975G7G1_9BACT|nr:hypothetical protein [Luteolibacter ambystomatis]QUE50358.1 hypothetical protein KBB96_15995 [Luteolibacter ambystomatis]